MKVFDMHSDIFTDIVNRRMRGQRKVFDRIHFPRLKAGGVNTLICAVWVEPTFAGNEIARFRCLLENIKADLMECEHVRVVRSDCDIEASSSKINIILGLEGLTFIEQWDNSQPIEKVDSSLFELDRFDFQHAILTYDKNNFLAGSSSVPDDNGVSELGKYVINNIREKKWMIDISHLGDRSSFDIFKIAEDEKTPILASHSNARELCPHPRNLTNDQIKEIASTNGIIGINAFGEFVYPQKPTIDHFIDHIIFIGELVGIEHVAFGFDFMDYLLQYNLDQRYSNFPEGLKDVTMIPNLLERMVQRGLQYKEMESICFQNAFKFYSRVNN